MKRICAIFLLLMSAFSLSAQTELDSIECSLITCSPGTEVYQLYGHTALRCRNFTRNRDVIFNYGVFSFEQPHFVWRFVRGKCDYMVMGMPWKYFPVDYQERGSRITAQILNLTPEESNRLYSNLIINCRKENCEYRYNFLYNNCTTQVRDQIEAAIDGQIEYPRDWEKKTYRQIIHEYTAESPWSQEGNDFLLGASVDTILTERAAMFAPEYLMDFMGRAQIRKENGDARPLVINTEIILQEKAQQHQPGFPLSPLVVSLLFLLLNVVILCCEYLSRKMWWLWDVLLMLVQGIVGLLLLFMFLFSEHPAVDSNWLLWPLNPLPLIALPYVVKAAIAKRRTLWHALNFAILTLFIIFLAWIPQDFGIIVVPLAASLLTRPISYHLFYQRKDIKRK